MITLPKALLLCALTASACLAAGKNTVILYENDVHCAIDGYSTFAGLRDAISDTANVLTVSVGDFLQGNASCASSKGESIVSLMNSVGYDAVTLGNHEFDYKFERLFELAKKLKTQITSVNFTKPGSSKPIFKPFVISTVGHQKVAFIGILTPDTQKSESYAFFDSTGRAIYELHEGTLYTLVNKAAAQARKAGAHYVVALAHLGVIPSSIGSISSTSLIQNTTGIDAVLDGHSHTTLTEQWIKNASGKDVLLSQTGSKFANIGKLTINANGEIHATLIPTKEIPLKSSKVTQTTDSIKTALAKIFDQQLSESSFDMTVSKDGQWVVRNTETNLGDLVADAFRMETHSQIGLVNAGGLRNDIPAGNITYRNVLDVMPFENDLFQVEATGSEIVTALEQGLSKYPNLSGAFLQVSGLRYKINASGKIESVEVENEDGSYNPIKRTQSYTVATSSYVARNGSEITAFRQSKILKDAIGTDTEALAKYFKSFGGTVPEKYKATQGRITY